MTSKRVGVVVTTIAIGWVTMTGLGPVTAAADDYVSPSVSELSPGAPGAVLPSSAGDTPRSGSGLAITGVDVVELGAIGVGAIVVGTVLARRRTDDDA